MKNKNLLLEKIDLDNKSKINRYKSKVLIISLSFILGAGTLLGVGAFGFLLHSTFTTSEDLSNILNKRNNQVTRASVWNQYISYLKNTNSSNGTGTKFDEIIQDDAFISQFISFLNEYLNIVPSNSIPNGVTLSEKNDIKNTLTNSINKPLFKDNNLAIYSNLFEISTSNSVISFSFKNSVTSPTIQFSLSIPMLSSNKSDSGWDLIFNKDWIPHIHVYNHLLSNDKNIKLTINKFTNPMITIPRTVYFKAGKIDFPIAIMSEFSLFLSNLISKEEIYRLEMNDGFSAIKGYIGSDTTNTVGMSYWNSFAINYNIGNYNFILSDLKKEISKSGIYSFLKTYAKDSSGNNIDDIDLNNINNDAQDSKLFINNEPLISNLTNSKTLFNTTGTTDKYSLELNISNFDYDYKITNLFGGPSSIELSPLLTLSGTLTKTPLSGSPIIYEIDYDQYDFKNIINNSKGNSHSTIGLFGFLEELVLNPDSQLSIISEGLVTLNSFNVTKQIAFWNDFNIDNSSAITSELKKSYRLTNFLFNNTDLSNLFGMDGFPNSDFFNLELVKYDMNEVATTFPNFRPTLNFKDNNDASMTFENIRFNYLSANNMFTKITIYFGYENDSIIDFDFLSKENIDPKISDSKVGVLQKLGSTTNLDTIQAIKDAASKRISVVFEIGSKAYVAYLGQSKSSVIPNQQISKAITFGSDLLTSPTGFLQAIININKQNF